MINVTTNFEFAFGSVVGYDHLKSGKFLRGRNNQDAVMVGGTPRGAMLAIVADGCGSGAHSEFGAQLTVNVLFRSLAKRYLDGVVTEDDLSAALMDLITHLRLVRGWLVGGPVDYLLSTVVGVLIGGCHTTVFWMGDGHYCVNDEMNEIGPFPNNAPPYPAYQGVFDPEELEGEIDRMSFETEVFDTEDLTRILIASDGFGDLLEALDGETTLPGRSGDSAILGERSRLWEDDGFFSNEMALPRFLNACNSDRTTLDDDGNLIHHPGLLPDDTTIFLARRRWS